jgi:hypothetical protein
MPFRSASRQFSAKDLPAMGSRHRTAMTPVLLADGTENWQPIPKWSQFLVNLGFGWPDDLAKPRRIALLSMPGESAAAGLIALGAQVKALENPMANDVDGHFDSLVTYARQYLNHCRSCKTRCQPSKAKCGYLSESTGRVKSINRPIRHFEIVDVSTHANRQISLSGQGGTISVFPPGAKSYHVTGEPPPVFGSHHADLPGSVYAEIVAGATVLPANLRRSYSGLCLAGRISGETITRESYRAIRFRSTDGDHHLEDLLTVHGWHASHSISRMTFFNSRTGEFDRQGQPPAITVADGDEAFLKVIATQEFQRSDVIGVFHRAIDRDRLEAIGNRLSGLRQWYEDDVEMRQRFANPPRGISSVFLRRRTN